jgi:N-dimethylarginine dimethylaminohydrolase
MKFGVKDEVGQIKSLLLKNPRDAFENSRQIDSQWKTFNFLTPPDYEEALREYEAFTALLERSIAEIHYLPKHDRTGLDSLYVRDPAIITAKGAILCKMGKPQREGEPQAAEEYLSDLGIPILGSIEGDGKLEGGDIVFFNEKTLAVGQGYRTNKEGIRQFKALIEDFMPDVVVVPLPHWKGPEDVLHLMSFISPVDKDKAVVYSRLLPVPFREWLLDRGVKLIEVPDEEYESMACNVLAVAPGQCIMLAGNPLTKQNLEKAGIQVWEYKGQEISLKGAGGPTCLTRPLLRID